MFKRIHSVVLLPILAASFSVQRDIANDTPLLTAISKDPDLSTFYSLFNSTGGSSGIPGPPFEERFNNLTDGRKYTAFAPVDSAFTALRPGLMAALTTSASYSLLESILRTHIAEGLIATEDVRTQGNSVISIEGIPLTFSSAGDTVTINNQATLTSVSSTVVGNGAIFKITSIIDPFVSIFGTDVNETVSTRAAQKSKRADPQSKDASDNPGSIASTLTFSPNLSTYSELLKKISPDFFDLLGGTLSNGRNFSVFAPSNAAFQAIGGTASTLQPSNQALSSYLLKYPFIDTTSTGQDMSILGFLATVRRDSTGTVTSVNNAAVSGEKNCVSNGCVYTVDRWLDPVFGLF